MKFWQKIYLFSLILFILTFNLSGIFMIEKFHNKTLKREVKRCLDEHLSIYSGISLNIPVYDTLKRYSRNTNSYDEILAKYAVDYLKVNNDNDAYIEISDKNSKKIFSNIKFKLPLDREEINLLNPKKRQYIIRDVDNKSYIFISNLIVTNKNLYTFTYVRNISEVYKQRKDQYRLFFKIDILISLIFMIFMYFISKYITKPIKNFIEATKRIAKGKFSEKVEIYSRDELGILAKHFNVMTEVVNEKIDQLEKNNMEKQRFIDNLTHELKTPLTSIIGYANLLRTTRYNEKIFIDGLNYIYKEGKRLEELSFRLMDLVLLKKEEFKMENKSIKKIVFEVKGILIPKLNKKNITLVITGDDFKMKMESSLIKILLVNIVDNAIKASKVNSKIYLSINEYTHEVEIEDYGIGISKEHIEKITEPFYMVDKARTRASNGAGLGLAICKKILDIHDAKLKVKSEINKGTSIKLIFNGSMCTGGDLFNDI